MRRLIAVSCFGTMTLLATAVFPNDAAAQTNTTQAAARGVNVAIDIRCLPGNGVQFSLAPWTAQLQQGDSIAWVLNQDANVPEITVSSKQDAWPFLEGPPYKGKAGKAPKAKGMKANLKVGDRFAYAVTAVCTRADGSTSSVIIDPDMIIIR
ncbi:MAG: hypothetical protein H0U59_11885 [Gemmatimonadaceae bacterium]|nr:hypothetical protein [Gemmatimonadaceae bacterium]